MKQDTPKELFERAVSEKYFIVIEIFRFETCGTEIPTLHGPYGTKEEARNIILTIIQALADEEPPEQFSTDDDHWECSHEATADITKWSIVQAKML